jgi:hypothetical protein
MRERHTIPHVLSVVYATQNASFAVTARPALPVRTLAGVIGRSNRPCRVRANRVFPAGRPAYPFLTYCAGAAFIRSGRYGEFQPACLFFSALRFRVAVIFEDLYEALSAPRVVLSDRILALELLIKVVSSSSVVFSNSRPLGPAVWSLRSRSPSCCRTARRHWQRCTSSAR